MKKEYLGELEELILLMVIMLKDEAYGLSVRNSLKEHANRNMSIGAVHGTINRLEKKGLLKSKLGGATEARGGRNKRLLSITNSGIQMLERSRDLKVSLWMKIPELSLNNF